MEPQDWGWCLPSLVCTGPEFNPQHHRDKLLAGINSASGQQCKMTLKRSSGPRVGLFSPDEKLRFYLIPQVASSVEGEFISHIHLTKLSRMPPLC